MQKLYQLKAGLQGTSGKNPNRSNNHGGKRAISGDAWGLPVRYPLNFFPPLGRITRCKNFSKKDFDEKRREEKESKLGVINE